MDRGSNHWVVDYDLLVDIFDRLSQVSVPGGGGGGYLIYRWPVSSNMPALGGDRLVSSRIALSVVANYLRRGEPD